ncbi:hypothetical protein [Klebsiella sp. BIGb0407]|uniref:hypothetical protein n=1 Tax=Klebsiella sp. BIGb0407 TaxID=2940603 RepID=UPI002169B602|nr:hypothetical protein [Klebsiella sp. BIGb0407]MCS3432535.1 hypothetical protein [Klebsiella sp. BIGb0407]
MLLRHAGDSCVAACRALKILADKVTEKTAQDWEKISKFSHQHFEEMKQLMIANDASVLD